MAEIFGVTGWKNSGKTTLLARLVAEFSRRGLRVSTVKHAHKGFEIDRPGTDSYAHREAGALEVAIASSDRWAIMHEVPSSGAAPGLDTMLAKLAPCDLVLVEGFKKAPHPKIECIGSPEQAVEAVFRTNDSIVALAADFDIADASLPRFRRNDVESIADHIAQMTGLSL